MRARRWLHFLRARSRPLLAASAIALAAAEIYVDVDTWIQLNVSIVYSLPLVLAAFARDRRLIWLLTAVLIGSTYLVYAHQMPPGSFSVREPFFVNRLLATVTLVLSAGLLHALTLAVDALERRGVEALEASLRKTGLLARVSHDLRTPITTINLMADLLRNTADNPKLAERAAELAKSLQANAVSLSNMVSNALDISAIDSGRSTVHRTRFDLDELLAQELDAIGPMALMKNLGLKFLRPPTPVVVYSDQVKVARIVRNLLSNAIKFTDSGGVTVARELDPAGAVVIRVSDTGVGIAEQDLDQIFSEFAQVGASIGEDKRGWGLGLAICRRLVNMIGATISVSSSAGGGTTFIVRLPPA